MGYGRTATRLAAGETVVIDGGTGTELERRGVAMHPAAWCGAATLANRDVLRQVHLDYIAAGARVITANTFASSRLMLEPAGLADQFAQINQVAVATAIEARERAGDPDVLVAGSLSHMIPVGAPEDLPAISAALVELADLHKSAGCDLILLEMMYRPTRMPAAFEAALATGLPVWAGFSARRGKDDEVLAFNDEPDIPFSDIVGALGDFDVQVAGVMHTSVDVIGDALGIVADQFDGPLMAYPDSGYFKMPEWHFEDIITPADLAVFAEGWKRNGAQILGGCCGLSPEHIERL